MTIGSTTGDRHDLARFVAAQDAGGTYQKAIDELQSERKRSHWMWFVFPQIAGLGHSQMSRQYAISSMQEAVAYMHHPVLGARLVECASVVAASQVGTADKIFGDVDAAKLWSSMTLFMTAAPEEDTFRQVLDKYFAGASDPKTLQLI